MIRRLALCLAGTLAIVGAIVAPSFGADPADCTWVVALGALAIVAA